MSSAPELQLIDSIAREGAQRRMLFSAHDVVLAAWQRGVILQPDQVISRVQSLVQQGALGEGYTWSVLRDRGVVVFHRLGDDPNQYRTGGGPMKPGGPGLIRRVIDFFSAWFSTAPLPSSSERSPLSTPLHPGRPQPEQFNPLAREMPPELAALQRAPASSPPARELQRPPQDKKLGLDAAQFLPISRDEQKARAGKISSAELWQGVRRDLIPPVGTERTDLIDRGMVTAGLLSPEQLAEIHRVGAAMDLVRVDAELIARETKKAGEAAVEEDRAARAAIKAKKKEEAARRKAQRAAEIAHRKENDIIYLGRGVSGRLGQRTSDADKLRELDLPALSTPAELAAALKISIKQLRWLAFHTEVASRTHYIQFTVPKRSGGLRTLSAPHRKLAKVQQWILRTILDKLATQPAAHGFVKSRSILTNAREHAGKQIVVNCDLENFFPTITFPRVRAVFQRCGYSPAVATLLALLCTEAPRKQVQYAGQTYYVAIAARGLPQGACTSPALSNQVARRLDKRLQGIATKLNLAYTRYADDLTFSGNEEFQERTGYLLARIRHIAQDEGFAVNEAKSRILRRNTSQEVTGLVVNERPKVPRKTVRRLRAILHGARKTGLAAQNREGRTHFHSWLRGMISFVAMSQPALGVKLQTEMAELLTKEGP